MLNRKGEISTIVILGTLAVIGVATLFGATVNNNRNTLNTRAEFDGTFCNDDIGDTLNTSGSTSFLINCWGNLNRKFNYVLFWCPEKSRGATYCGDIRDINSSAAQVIDRADGTSLTSYMRKTTDKTCGCVQWDVGVFNSSGQEGVAGGAIFCSDSPCASSPPPSPSNPPPSVPPPTSPPAQNTPRNTPTVRPTTRPTATPVSTSCRPGQTKCIGSNVCVDFQDQCPTPTPTSTSCRPGQIKCIGSNICADFQDQCPTPTPTPTYAQQSDEYPPTRVPTYTQQNDEYPSPTPTSYNVFIPRVGINEQPTPAPTLSARGKQIQTQIEIIGKSCQQGPTFEFTDLTSGCIADNAETIEKLNTLLNP